MKVDKLQRYLLGIGSNIAPDTNMKLAEQRLIDEDPDVWFSSIIETEPRNMISDSIFQNRLAVIHSSLTQSELKTRLNSIETDMGRDRNHPESKRRDRPIDIDILETITRQTDWELLHHKIDSYFSPLLSELKNNYTF